jgi:tetratricopeptide (TPR) repeat protein/predicted Ser/Thr protein kinase
MAPPSGDPPHDQTHATGAASDRIGHYRILGALGAGGMGFVYRARDERLGRLVAIKLLKDYSDPDAIERFFHEARAASSLNHPNIVTVYDVGESKIGSFIVMELVRGRGLRALMDEPIDIETFVKVARQVAEGLAVAHEAGIVHRDIKPENIMVRDDGYVKILDFGLARLAPRVHQGSAVQTAILTESRTLIGTIKYMSPEQANGTAVDSSCDVFSLGIVLYELATRNHPFEAGSRYGVLHAILSNDPVPPSRLNAEFSGPLEALILKMLTKERSRRPTAAEVAAALGQPAAGAVLTKAASAAPKPHSVGRARERRELWEAFHQVRRGRGLLLCVTGEAGIGKSTLVDEFLTEVVRGGVECRVARGRCSERLAGAEAYLPLLDALGDLLRSEQGSLVRLMKTVAPLWYAQVQPPDVQSSGRSVLSPTQRGNQERLKRELVAFLEDACRRSPIVLFFDDLHWVDVSTVDVLGYLARHFESLPLLIVVTYRPTEFLIQKHPFVSTMRDLQGRGDCREMNLEFLTRDEIEQYLALKFSNQRLPRSFGDVIYAKTEGNPLFVVDVLDYLCERHVLSHERDEWILTRTVPDIARDLPESVRGMIQRKIDTFDAANRRLLVAASVQGYEFDAAVLAQVLGLDAADVEEQLDAIDKIHGFVRRVREQEFPDRTLTLRYRFVHVLYQNILYDSLTPARKASLSRSVAQSLEEFHRRKPADVVSELAVLFEAAREFSTAAGYFLQAARKAAHVFAYEEAVVLGLRALENLAGVTDGVDRRRRELAVLMTIGVPAIASRGFSSPAVQEIFDRATPLCVEFHETGQLAVALWGLAANHIVKLQLDHAWEAVSRLKHLAQEGHDASVPIQGDITAGVVCYYRGEFEQALEQFGDWETRCSLDQRRLMCRTLGYDQIVSVRSYRAWTLWCLGYADRARAEIDAAVQSAADVDHAYTTAFALTFAGVLDFWRGDWEQLQVHNERALSIANKEAFAYFAATSTCLDGLCLVHDGRRDAGLARLQEGLNRLASIEGRSSRRRVVSEYTELLARDGRVEEGLSILDAEIETIQSDNFWDAELFRVRGELLVMRGHQSEIEEAERWLRRAVDVARQQHAKWLELRAAMGLARLWQKEGKTPDARSLLSSLYDWFTEGFDTPDLVAARELLVSLNPLFRIAH